MKTLRKPRLNSTVVRVALLTPFSLLRFSVSLMPAAVQIVSTDDMFAE